MPTRKFSIRKVSGRKNEALLKALHRATFGDDPLPNFRAGLWWVGYDDDNNEAVAFAGMQQGSSHNTGYLVRCGVIPKAQGAGLQRRFIRIREKAAREKGLEYLVTDTTDVIHSSNNLIREGFLTYSPPNPWAFKRSIYWRKAIGRTS